MYCQPNRAAGMASALLSSLALTAVIAGSGCTKDYNARRPPVDQVTQDEKGLGSKDVVSASDQMAQDLLASPDLNASHTQWTMVVADVENKTTGNHFDLNIFIERLRSNLSQYGKGRVQLIENRDKLRQLQSKELEYPSSGSDQYGQGGGGGGHGAPGPAGIQPDYALYGRIMELPNRGTSYFLCEFTVTDLKTRQQVWVNKYEVKTAR